MKSTKRALLYGLGVWVGLVAISLVLLPFEGKNLALYESIKMTALVAVALVLSILYMPREGVASEGVASLGEAALIGFGWAAICVLLDIGLYLAGAFNISLGEYFNDVASSYLVIPVITTLSMGYLTRKTV